MGDEGTSFTIDLPVTGQERIDAAALSVDALAAKLDVVSKATLAASDAVKAGDASYRTAEQTMNRAAKAVERIGLASEAQRGKLALATDAGDLKGVQRAEKAIQALSARQGEAQVKAAGAKTALEAEAKALDALKAKAKAADDAESKLKKAIALKSAKNEGPAFETINRGLRKLGGPLADAGDRVLKFGSGFEKLKGVMGGTGAAIVGTIAVAAALVVAFVAVTAAAVAAVVSIATWAVTLGDANRQSSLLAQGMVQSVKGGEALNASIKAISKTLPVTNEELATMAKGFAYAGYRGKDLQAALQQSATWAARLKFGPDFAKEMLSLDEQSKVFKANIAGVFGGLKIEGILGALQKMIALFDDTTASGKAIKVVFESVFQPLLDGVAGAQFKVEAFFLQLEIWALKALIAIKPFGSTILAFVEVLAVGAAFIAGIVVAALGLLVAAFAAVGVAMGLVVVGAKAIGEFLGDAVFSVVDFASKVVPEFLTAGKAMIEGLVAGIKNAGGAVFDALKGVVTGAVKGVEKLLGIASPSKVFAEIGLQTGAGMEAGVNSSAGGVQDSLESMVSPPAGNRSGGAGATAPQAAKSGVNLENVQFVFHGVQGAEDAIERFRDVMTRVLEGDVTSLGGMVPNA